METKEKPTASVANFGSNRSIFDVKSMNKLVFSAQKQYSTVVHHAKHVGLKHIIAGLVEARKNHDLDDESFAEVMEVFLSHYIENEVSSRVDELLSSRFMPMIVFGLGAQK